MEIKHLALPRAAVKIVDVLRHQEAKMAPGLEARQRSVDAIGRSLGHTRVAHHAPSPVALPGPQLGAEGLKLDRLARPPGTARAPVVGNARIGGAACPREHHGAPRQAKKALKGLARRSDGRLPSADRRHPLGPPSGPAGPTVRSTPVQRPRRSSRPAHRPASPSGGRSLHHPVNQTFPSPLKSPGEKLRMTSPRRQGALGAKGLSFPAVLSHPPGP